MLAAAVLSWGCRGGLDTLRDPGADLGIFFPRWGCLLCDRPLGAIVGTVVLEDGCLWIVPDHAQWRLLAIWPAGSTPQRSDGTIDIRDAKGERLASAGERLTFGGGERIDPADIASLIGREPPPPCRGSRAWMVTGVIEGL